MSLKNGIGKDRKRRTTARDDREINGLNMGDRI